MLSNSAPSFRSRIELPTRDDIDASSPLKLIEVGWVFAVEPTIDRRWKVSGCKGETHLEAVAAHIEAAFQMVEAEARRSEVEKFQLAA